MSRITKYRTFERRTAGDKHPDEKTGTWRDYFLSKERENSSRPVTVPPLHSFSSRHRLPTYDETDRTVRSHRVGQKDPGDSVQDDGTGRQNVFVHDEVEHGNE